MLLYVPKAWQAEWIIDILQLAQSHKGPNVVLKVKKNIQELWSISQHSQLRITTVSKDSASSSFDKMSINEAVIWHSIQPVLYKF